MTPKKDIPLIKRPGFKKLMFSRLNIDASLKSSKVTKGDLVEEQLHKGRRAPVMID
jgi:hypothetical protein